MTLLCGLPSTRNSSLQLVQQREKQRDTRSHPWLQPTAAAPPSSGRAISFTLAKPALTVHQGRSESRCRISVRDMVDGSLCDFILFAFDTHQQVLLTSTGCFVMFPRIGKMIYRRGMYIVIQALKIRHLSLLYGLGFVKQVSRALEGMQPASSSFPSSSSSPSGWRVQLSDIRSSVCSTGVRQMYSNSRSRCRPK